MTADPSRWMWAEACAMIERAEQSHRQFFQPAATAARASWEPPVDVFESDRELLIVVALPGVDSQDVQVSSEHEVLLVAGVRRLPEAACGTAIRRLEIPQGRFERRIRLPEAGWQVGRSAFMNGCLLLSVTKPA